MVERVYPIRLDGMGGCVRVGWECLAPIDHRQGAQLLGTKRELLGPRPQLTYSGDVGDAG